MRFWDVQLRHPVMRYAIAIAAVPIAILIRFALVPIMGPYTQYVTVFPAILVVALLAGRGPAIITAVLGAAASALLFEPTPDWHTLTEIGWVALSAVLAGWMAQQLRSALAAAETKSRDLSASESFFRQTIESIPGMVFTTRPDGWCDYLSRQWVEYTGMPLDSQLGEGWSDLVHPDDRQRALSVWHTAVQNDTDYDIEYRVRRRDGQYEWFKVRGKTIRDQAGRIVRWFGVAVNVDVFRRTQEELISLKNSLEEQKKELESIISIVSHDLRAPLLNIRGFSDILEKDCAAVQAVLASSNIAPETSAKLDGILQRDVPEALDYIEISTTAMHNLVESLVKVARAGLVVPKPEPLDMNQLVHDIVASLRMKCRTAGVSIDVSDLPPCYADRTHVTQVFTNLIDNAIKYLDPERKGLICVEGMVEGDHALYWVCDNGIGIDPADEAKVFDIFFQVDGKTAGGEGIGLAVVKRMLERNAGRIWLLSEKDKGTNFFLTLPLTKGDLV